MRINNSEINLGKLVFVKRLEKKITQQELSNGICSITYLSKLENSKIPPSNEIIILLLERLGVQFGELETTKMDFIANLERWYQAIVSKNEISMTDYYYKLLSEQLDDLYSAELLYYFNLIHFMDSIFKGNEEVALDSLRTLHANRDKFTEQQSAYFEYFTGLYYCLLKKDYSKGILYFERVIPFFTDPSNEDAEFFYHLSLTYTNVNNIRLALIYIEKALELYNNQMLFKKIINCKIILAINYGRQKEYELAKYILENLLNALSEDTVENIQIKSKVIHNLGFMYSETGHYDIAIAYYLQAIALTDDKSHSYLNMVLELVLNMKSNQQEEEALRWIQTALSKKIHSPSEVIQLNIIEKQILQLDEELITYLEEEAIPYFEEINNQSLMLKYYEMIGLQYDKLFQYKKSSKYFRKCIDILKKT